jgi:hypothetical protein
MQSFELQVLDRGKWKMDSVYDDRTLAIAEAERVNEGRRYVGIRVVEEVYDEATNMSKCRTLFRGGTGKTEEPHKPKAATRPKGAMPRTGRGGEPVGSRRAEPKAKKSSFLGPVMMLLVVALVGAVAFFGLEHLSSLK